MDGTSARFCGACGARIGAEEVFCGQCGTPVGASHDGSRTIQGQSFDHPGSFADGFDETWQPAQNEQLTEAFAPSTFAASGRGGSNPAYLPIRYASGPQFVGPATAADAGRTARIIAGSLCLAGSLASAATRPSAHEPAAAGRWSRRDLAPRRVAILRDTAVAQNSDAVSTDTPREERVMPRVPGLIPPQAASCGVRG
jgi:hypothetical protein